MNVKSGSNLAPKVAPRGAKSVGLQADADCAGRSTGLPVLWRLVAFGAVAVIGCFCIVLCNLAELPVNLPPEPQRIPSERATGHTLLEDEVAWQGMVRLGANAAEELGRAGILVCRRDFTSALPVLMDLANSELLSVNEQMDALLAIGICQKELGDWEGAQASLLKLLHGGDVDPGRVAYAQFVLEGIFASLGPPVAFWMERMPAGIGSFDIWEERIGNVRKAKFSGPFMGYLVEWKKHAEIELECRSWLAQNSDDVWRAWFPLGISLLPRSPTSAMTFLVAITICEKEKNVAGQFVESPEEFRLRAQRCVDIYKDLDQVLIGMEAQGRGGVGSLRLAAQRECSLWAEHAASQVTSGAIRDELLEVAREARLSVLRQLKSEVGSRRLPHLGKGYLEISRFESRSGNSAEGIRLLRFALAHSDECFGRQSTESGYVLAEIKDEQDRLGLSHQSAENDRLTELVGSLVANTAADYRRGMHENLAERVRAIQRFVASVSTPGVDPEDLSVLRGPFPYGWPDN